MLIHKARKDNEAKLISLVKLELHNLTVYIFF